MTPSAAGAGSKRRSSRTYHFAVVIDDSDQQVDLVIRGEDLLASTGRQLLRELPLLFSGSS